jgi:UDP-glucose 4-epimerase
MSFSKRMRSVVMPILDVMQTMPSFVYLIPVVMLLGIGKVPGLIAVVIYALPPVIRLTDLGIRLVDRDVIEAADAYGSSRWQRLAQRDAMVGERHRLPLTEFVGKRPTTPEEFERVQSFVVAQDAGLRDRVVLHSDEEPIFDVQTNLVATLQLLEAMRSFGIKDLVFASSGGTVYGPPLRAPIDEEHPTNPTTSYGITKLAIEKYLLLEKQLHGLKPVILRVANPYGERQRVEFAQGVVAAFLKRALANEPIEIWGDGAVVRDYLHVGDVAEAFAAALDYRGDECTFNIGSGSGTSLHELVAILGQALGRDLRVEYRPGRDFDVKSNVLCCEKAHKVLGWRPKVPMEEGLQRTVNWLKSGA